MADHDQHNTYISPGISRERSFIRTSNQQVMDMVITLSIIPKCIYLLINRLLFKFGNF